MHGAEEEQKPACFSALIACGRAHTRTSTHRHTSDAAAHSLQKLCPAPTLDSPAPSLSPPSTKEPRQLRGHALGVGHIILSCPWVPNAAEGTSSLSPSILQFLKSSCLPTVSAPRPSPSSQRISRSPGPRQLNANPGFLLDSCVPLGMLPDVSVPQIPPS